MKTVKCKCCEGTGREIDHAALGESLRQLRKSAGLSLKQVAESMNLSTSYICDLELGRRKWDDDKIGSFRFFCEFVLDGKKRINNKTKGTK